MSGQWFRQIGVGPHFYGEKFVIDEPRSPGPTNRLRAIAVILGMTTDKSNPNKLEFDTEETDEEFLAKFSHNEAELWEAISILIKRRELLRDCEIELLEDHCNTMMECIAVAKQRILLEELDCFKQVLKLHRRLMDRDQS